MSSPRFVWCLHQPAATRWLKQDVARLRPELRFAFSAPGLTTFKVPAAPQDDGSLPPAAEVVGSAFARASGWSLGRAADVAEVLAFADQLADRPVRLHVFERDPDVPADERDPALVGARPRALEQLLRAAAPERFAAGQEARPGEVVLDVITPASEADAAEPVFVGWHRQHDVSGRWPGGVSHVPIPATSPSRAWAKIEEAIAWSGLTPAAGEVALEMGSAPGGASFALLERGLTVHGIDPGRMAPAVLNYRGAGGNRFVHHALPAAKVERKALPRRIHWLASDVNLAPMVALKYIERLVALLGPPLRGAFLTLKLNDDGVFDALPGLQTRIERLLPGRARYVQLPAHRSEIVAIVESPR
ncbi:MAG TPA: hypothetical protein VGG33_05495 [Polyangia bacterium]